MKDLGATDTILGIKLVRTEQRIGISQSHCIESVLEKYEYFDLPELFNDCMLYRFTSKPGKAHWGAIQSLMSYLEGTLDGVVLFWGSCNHRRLLRYKLVL